MNEIEKTKQTKQNIGIVAICLGFYFCMMPFDSFSLGGASSLMKIFVLVPVAAVLFLKKQKVFRIDAMSVMLIIYTISILISCTYSINKELSRTQFQRTCLNIIVILIVGSMCIDYNHREIKFLKTCLVIGGLATVFLTFHFANYDSAGRLTLMVNGVAQDQNYINGYMFFAYIYFLILLLKKKKILSFVPIGLILYFMLLTGSRTALIAYALMTLGVSGYYLLESGRLKPGMVIAVLIILVLFMVFYNQILSLLPAVVAQRFSLSYIEQHGTTGRLYIWIYLLLKYLHSGIFRTFLGYGFGTTAYINEYNYLVAHNVLIDHLLMGGIFGLAIFVLMHLVFLRETWKTHDSFLIGTYIGYLFMMMCLSLLTYKPIWNMMIMILIIRHRQTNDMRENGEL